MKHLKKVLISGAAAAAMGLAAAPAVAGVEASVGVHNIYLFRGLDDSEGGAHVEGELGYSHDASGLYAGIWGGSVPSSSGGEVNLFAGWAGEFGGLGVDLGVLSYYFAGDSDSDDIGDFTELYLGLSFAGLEAYYYNNVAGDSGYEYFTLGYGLGPVSALVGYADDGTDDYTHIDLSYAFNDNLSFTVSQVVDSTDALGLDERPLFVVSYSIPLM